MDVPVMSPTLKPLARDPDLVLGTNGRIYVNAGSLPFAERQGRRVVRCVELTPGEEVELLQRVGDRAGALLVGLTAKRGGSR
jgi:hypothetical protein